MQPRFQAPIPERFLEEPEHGRRRSFKWLLVIPAGILLLLIFGGRITDMMFPTAIKGHLIDAVYIPDTNGAGSLWFHTDDSFYYASTVETGGSEPGLR